MKQIIIDFNDMETADDERSATIHYGGVVKIWCGDQESSFYPSGNDRCGAPWDDLRDFLVTEFGLDFSQIEKPLIEKSERENSELGDDYFNLFYLDNIGNQVLITAEDDGTVVEVRESDSEKLQLRMMGMIQEKVIQMLNSPGTWFAYDPNDEFEFSFRWVDGETVVMLDENQEYKFQVKVVSA